jgi:hypothetical protein
MLEKTFDASRQDAVLLLLLLSDTWDVLANHQVIYNGMWQQLVCIRTDR